MKIRGKEIPKSDINIALEDFYSHARNTIISRKAIRFGKHYDNYFSRNINEMSCYNYSLKKTNEIKITKN